MAAQQLAFGQRLEWQQDDLNGFRAHVVHNIVHGKGKLERMAAFSAAEPAANAGKSWFFCERRSVCYLFLTLSTAPSPPRRSLRTPQPQHIDSDTRGTSATRAGARKQARWERRSGRGGRFGGRDRR